MSTQRRLARFACEVDYASLPSPITAWAKGAILDTIGCAIAGSDGPPVQIARSLFGEIGGLGESTVIGSGERLPCASAAWVNTTAARYEDMNDVYPVEGRVGHFSEVIPTALAIGERVGASGEDVIAAVVVGYEVLAATTFHGPKVGVGFATFGSIASPIVAGKLLGLDEDRLVSAIGISLSSNVTLISWLGAASGSMLKASTWASNAHHGILAALLAERGLTGPETAIDTYLEQVAVSDPDTALPPARAFVAHERTMIKKYAAQMSILGPIESTLRLRRDRGIRPEQVDAIVVRATSDLVRYAAGPETARPRSREAADHSAPFVIAVALTDGDVLPDQYRQQRWDDPRVIELMQKITCEADESFDARAAASGSMPSRVEIRCGGSVYVDEIEAPQGHPTNPMTPGQIEEKFRRVVSSSLSQERQEMLVALARGLDELATIRDLMQATIL